MIRYGQDFIRRRKTLLIWAAALLVVFALVGFFVVPPILKSVLATQLTAALHREVAIREVRFNPFALSATVRGLTVKEPKGSADTFASFEELYVNLEVFSLLRWAVVVREVRLTKPFVRLVRRADESYNFSDLLPGPQPQPTTPAKPVRFSVNNIQVIDGGADVRDETVQKTHTVRELTIGIPFVSNIPSDVQTFVQPGLSVQVNGTRYAIEGKTKPFADSLETTLDVNISDLDVPYYLAYVPKDLLTFAMPSCRLDAKLVIAFVRKGKVDQTLTVKGDAGLREVAVDDKQGAPVVRIPKLSLGLASVEPLARKVHLSRIALESPELTVRREKTGITNIETLLPKPAPTQNTARQGSRGSGRSPSLWTSTRSASPGLRCSSRISSPPVPFKTTLAPIDVKVQQLSTRPNTKGTYNLTLATEAKEQIALEGSMALAPVVVEGKVDLKAVALKKYAPYYSDMIRFDIETGKLDLSTRYRYAQGEKEPDITASEAALSVTGLRLKRRDEKEAFVRVPVFTVQDTAIDVTQRQVTVGMVVHPEGFRECDATGRWRGGSPEAHGPAAGRPGRGRGNARRRAEALGRDGETGDGGPVHGQGRRPGCRRTDHPHRRKDPGGRRQHHHRQKQDRKAEPLIAPGSERHRQSQYRDRAGPAAGRRQGSGRRRRLEAVRPVLQEPLRLRHPGRHPRRSDRLSRGAEPRMSSTSNSPASRPPSRRCN